MVNVADLTMNAVFYVFFVVFSASMAIVFAFLIGHKLFERQKKKMQLQATKIKNRMGAR